MLSNAEMTQGSPEWLEMRKKMIGASEAASILGISPYKTAHELWLEKTGRVTPPPSNFAMRRGQELEPEIRRMFQEESGEFFIPQVVVHPEYDYLIASLDGINLDGNALLEIKTCNKEVFDKCKSGEIVPYYLSQIQHQLACCPKAEVCYYVCFHGNKMSSFAVYRDEEYIAKMIEAEKAFYQCMINDTPPALTAQDEAKKRPDIEGSDALIASDDYVQIKEERDRVAALLKSLDAKKKEAEERLLQYANDGNCMIGCVQITRSEPKGLVNWKKVIDEYNILDEKLDWFRNPSSVKWTITVKKDS